MLEHLRNLAVKSGIPEDQVKRATVVEILRLAATATVTILTVLYVTDFRIYDAAADHTVRIAPEADEAADRTLLIPPLGGANRRMSVADDDYGIQDQGTKTTDAPTFNGGTFTANVDIGANRVHATDTNNYVDLDEGGHVEIAGRGNVSVDIDSDNTQSGSYFQFTHNGGTPLFRLDDSSTLSWRDTAGDSFIGVKASTDEAATRTVNFPAVGGTRYFSLSDADYGIIDQALGTSASVVFSGIDINNGFLDIARTAPLMRFFETDTVDKNWQIEVGGGSLIIREITDGGAAVVPPFVIRPGIKTQSSGVPFFLLDSGATIGNYQRLAGAFTLDSNEVDMTNCGLSLEPRYDDDSSGYSVTRHNYISLSDVVLDNTATVTDGCVFKFDANAGTHAALDSAAGGSSVDYWMKINQNGALGYIPCLDSPTDNWLFNDLEIDGALNHDGSTAGLYNTTPVAQHSSTGQTAGFTAGTGSGVNDDSTFTGGVGATAYTIGDVVKALKNLGVMAQ